HHRGCGHVRQDLLLHLPLHVGTLDIAPFPLRPADEFGLEGADPLGYTQHLDHRRHHAGTRPIDTMSTASNMPAPSAAGAGGFVPLTSRAKQVSEKKMTLMERIYLPAVIAGLFITIKHFFRLKRPTIQYPEQQRPFSKVYRGQ